VLYALAIVLLLLVMLAVGAAESSGPGADLFAGAARIFLILYLIGAIAGDPNLGMFGYVLLTVIALIMLPIVIAMIFSAWAATRPSVSAAA
jgi:hypothetical protein